MKKGIIKEKFLQKIKNDSSLSSQVWLYEKYENMEESEIIDMLLNSSEEVLMNIYQK